MSLSETEKKVVHAVVTVLWYAAIFAFAMWLGRRDLLNEQFAVRCTAMKGETHFQMFRDPWCGVEITVLP